MEINGDKRNNGHEGERTATVGDGQKLDRFKQAVTTKNGRIMRMKTDEDSADRRRPSVADGDRWTVGM